MKRKLQLMSLFLLGLFSFSTVNAQFDYMSIVGDATPVGFVPQGIQMDQDGNVFTYKGVLKAGGFKFHAYNGGWCDGQWINPSVDGQTITATDYIITTGCDGPDNKWSVTEPGSYSIAIDLDASTIQINKLNFYPNLYLVGDATPGGWSLDMATAMQADDLSSEKFTWSGKLVSGSFKIATAKTFDDGWDWLMPSTSDQDLGLTDYQVVLSGSGTDNSWSIDAADVGNYDITVNLESETIIIKKSEPTYTSNFDVSKVNAYFNETTKRLAIKLGSQIETNISVYSITGKAIYKTKITGDKTLDTSSLGGAGLKLVHVSNHSFTKVFKIIVQ